MKKVEFDKKDGTKGTKYIAEPGDKVTSRFESPRATTLGKYENYSMGIEGDIPYLQLTKGQHEKLMQSGNIQGKTIEFYEYENDFGKQTGVKVLPEQPIKTEAK